MLARHRRIFYLWRPQLSDPGDEAMLELAIAAGRVPIVTYNLDHFRRAGRFGVRVLSAQDILIEIGAVE